MDGFLRLFGVSLQPDKSTLIKVGTAVTARWTETERISLLRTDADGTVKPIEIRRAAPSEATRYLGLWLQGDRGWEGMQAKALARVATWFTALRKAG